MLTAYDAETVGYDLGGSTLCRTCAVKATNAIYVWKVDARMDGWACDPRGLEPLSRYMLQETMIQRSYETAREYGLVGCDDYLAKMSNQLRWKVEARAAYRYEDSERCEKCGVVLVCARGDWIEYAR